MDKPIIGISIGDLNGIGPEVVIKTFSDNRILDMCTPVIFSSAKVLNFYRKTIQEETPFNFTNTKDITKLNPKQVNVFNCWEEDVTMQPGVLTETGGRYAVRSLTVAGQCLKDGEIDALVTAPIHKNNTHSPSFNFTGHTPYLQELFMAKDVVMLLYHQALRVALVTEHVPISGVAPMITEERLHSKINILLHTLKRDFGIDKPKIAVLGLNPHAGDNGTIGSEELNIIKPVIEQYRQQNQIVIGPYSADAFFARGHYRHFDAVLAMYHDQGLVPFKTLAAGEGVNYTAGLPAVRTSPDHGTGFDIAGKGIADPSSFREAVFQAIDLIRQRRNYDEATANPLKRSVGKRER